MLYCPIAIIQLLLEGPSLNGKACRAASLSSFPQVPQEVTVQLGAEAKRRNIFLFWPGKSCYRKTPRAVPPAPAAAEKMLQGIVPGQTQLGEYLPSFQRRPGVQTRCLGTDAEAQPLLAGPPHGRTP